MKLEHRLMNINMAVAKYNTGILFVKSAMDWFPGYYGGPTRKPLLPLDKTSLDGLKKAFVDNGFLWTFFVIGVYIDLLKIKGPDREAPTLVYKFGQLSRCFSYEDSMDLKRAGHHKHT